MILKWSFLESFVSFYYVHNVERLRRCTWVTVGGKYREGVCVGCGPLSAGWDEPPLSHLMKWLSVICTRRVPTSVRSECVCERVCEHRVCPSRMFMCMSVCVCLGEVFPCVCVCVTVMSIYFSVYSLWVCLASPAREAGTCSNRHMEPETGTLWRNASNTLHIFRW